MNCFCDMLTKRDENSGERWLELYGDALCRFAMFRVQDSFTAEDLVWEPLLAVDSSHKNFSGKSIVKTWLPGILKRKIFLLLPKP